MNSRTEMLLEMSDSPIRTIRPVVVLALLLLALPLGCGRRTPSDHAPVATDAASRETDAPNGTTDAVTETEDAPSAAAATAPTPFSADSIRDAMPLGATRVFRSTTPDGPEMTRAMRVVEWSTRDTVIEESITVGDEAPVSRRGRSTWEDLRRHALFPADVTTIGTERHTVPAGTFDTVRYVVEDRRDDDTQHVFYFAVSLPGPPIDFYTERAGEIVTRTQLIEYR